MGATRFGMLLCAAFLIGFGSVELIKRGYDAQAAYLAIGGGSTVLILTKYD